MQTIHFHQAAAVAASELLVTLIRPPILVPDQNPIVQFTPPLGLAYVAGSLKAVGFRVCVIDGLGESLDVRHPTDNECHLYGLHPDEIVERIPADSAIIGISAAFTFEWPTCRDLIRRIRARFPRALLIGGGEHVTALPEMSLRESALDVAVLGEGEEVTVAVAHAHAASRSMDGIAGIAFKDAAGTVKLNPRYSRIRNIDDIPWPAWDLLPIEQYLERGMGFGVHRGRSMPVMASRGCPYQCTFCSSPQMWTTRWIARDPERLLDELEHYQRKYRIDNFDFYDLTAIVKKAWIVEFCAKIKARGMRFTWQLPSGTRSEAIDDDVARLLYDSGCRNLSYAPESGSPAILTKIKKKIHPDRLVESIRGSVAAGLNVKCNLMLGFPGESPKEVRETFGFIARVAWAGAHDLSIWAFSPYPGSELFSELHQAGRLRMDEQYYERLRSYSDASRTISYSDQISDRRLKLLRWIGTVQFYLVSWLRRPWRPFVSLYNVARGVHESRSELALSTLLRKLFMSRGKELRPGSAA